MYLLACGRVFRHQLSLFLPIHNDGMWPGVLQAEVRNTGYTLAELAAGDASVPTDLRAGSKVRASHSMQLHRQWNAGELSSASHFCACVPAMLPTSITPAFGSFQGTALARLACIACDSA